MGLFSGMFGSKSPVEARLENEYVPLLKSLLGAPLPEAKKAFQEMLERCKQGAQASGTTQLPDKYGDILLQQEATNPRAKALLAKARNEGARDDDIKLWWNMHDLDRRMVMEIDNMLNINHYVTLRNKGLSAEQSAVQIKQFQVYYGDPDDTTYATGDDRLLPYELKDRINRWNLKNDMTQEKFELGDCKTMNALVRREIRKGNI